MPVKQMEASKIFEILNSTKRFWTTGCIEAGVPREALGRCLREMDRKEVLLLKGVRRSGKSTLMAQMIQTLLEKNGEKGDPLCAAGVFFAWVLGGNSPGDGEMYAYNDALPYGDRLASFLAKPPVKILPATQDTAEIFGLVKDRLRRTGTPIPINNVWIAAQALEAGAQLVTYDVHFRKVEGRLL